MYLANDNFLQPFFFFATTTPLFIAHTATFLGNTVKIVATS